LHRTALVTGFTGQDGTFLTRLLLDKGYRVVGLARGVSSKPPVGVRGKFDFTGELASGRLVPIEGDLLSRASLDHALSRHQPDEIYNLAAPSHVAISFNQPELTVEATFLGVVNLIESLCAGRGGWRMYQASTSEMFGNPPVPGDMDEQTPMQPTSPYAIAKAAAHFYCRMKREQGFFISNGILFNHESEIRGREFVSQKIVRATVALLAGPHPSGEPLELGNLNARRDWGYAGDYVEAMWLMLQQPQPGEFCVGTGVARTVRQFVEAAVAHFDKKIEWRGSGIEETGLVDGRVFVRVNPEYFRPNDVNYTSANATKAHEQLGWAPQTSFDLMVGTMIQAEIERQRQRIA
jgi:GDPmannose 4,6-dehydratase